MSARGPEYDEMTLRLANRIREARAEQRRGLWEVKNFEASLATAREQLATASDRVIAHEAALSQHLSEVSA